MQRTLTALLLFLFTMPAWAQAPIPGTFNRTQPLSNRDLYSIPLITTPQISFGSALTPPVIVTGQTMVVSSPHVEYNPSLLSNAEEMAEPTYEARQGLNRVPVSPFEYVVAPNSGVAPGEMASEGESLGEAAAALRKGPPPTQHSFSNEDINRMNESSTGNFAMPAGKPQQQQQTPPANQAPQKNQSEQPHSPFAPQLSAEE
jgi:hypothetical protein